jgi:hypothetical protein
VINVPHVCLYMATETYDPVSILIRERTECAWSHVGFFNLENNQTFSAMCDGKGVAWRPIGRNQKILLLDVAPGMYMQNAIQMAFNKALTQIGKPYNELDILGITLGRDWCTADRFICSTLVLWAFDQIGTPLLGMWALPIDHMTPRDVLLSPLIIERKQ